MPLELESLGASTGADNAGPLESDIEVLVKKRALRCLATTCDPGGRPGPCTRTDETNDCEVVHDGSWLQGVVDSKCSSFPILSHLNLLKFC